MTIPINSKEINDITFLDILNCESKQELEEFHKRINNIKKKALSEEIKHNDALDKILSGDCQIINITQEQWQEQCNEFKKANPIGLPDLYIFEKTVEAKLHSLNSWSCSIL